MLHGIGDSVELLVIVDVEATKQAPERVTETAVIDELAIGVGRDHKSRRNGDVRLGEFAQVRSLATNEGDIIPSDFGEPDDVAGV